MHLVRFFPATQGPVNGEQADVGKLFGVLGPGFPGDHRAIEVFTDDVLTFLGVQVLELGRSNGPGTPPVHVFIDYRHSGLGQ